MHVLKNEFTRKVGKVSNLQFYEHFTCFSKFKFIHFYISHSNEDLLYPFYLVEEMVQLKMSMPDGLDCLSSFAAASKASYFKPFRSTLPTPCGKGGTTVPQHPKAGDQKQPFPGGEHGHRN